MKPIIEVFRLGRIPYNKALNIQQVLFDKLKADCQNPNQTRSAKNSLLLLEHEPVYTVGIRSEQYNHDFVLKLQDRLARGKLQAEFIKTNRGGLITFHGPGQLVAYPIIQLGDFNKSIPNKSVKAYVKRLENTIIDTLARVGVQDAHTVPEYPGVWLDSGDRKIAFVGITCKRYVTMHGVSINCDCDLSWFEHIVSCGIEGKPITSIRQEILSKPIMDKMLTGDIHVNRGVDCLPGADQSSLRLAASYDNPNPVRHDESNRDDLSENKRQKYGVQHVANAFCLSFSQQFGCELQERWA